METSKTEKEKPTIKAVRTSKKQVNVMKKEKGLTKREKMGKTEKGDYVKNKRKKHK